MAEHPLQDKVVAVVGASGALGGLIARGAAERGAHLVLVGRDEARLKEAGIEATVTGREKHIFSIYKKMVEKHLSFSEVLDIYGFRVIVKDCLLYTSPSPRDS